MREMKLDELIKNYKNTETKECTFIPNKVTRQSKSKSKSKILSKSKIDSKNKNEEEDPIYEKLYKVILYSLYLKF